MVENKMEGGGLQLLKGAEQWHGAGAGQLLSAVVLSRREGDTSQSWTGPGQTKDKRLKPRDRL